MDAAILGNYLPLPLYNYILRSITFKKMYIKMILNIKYFKTHFQRLDFQCICGL